MPIINVHGLPNSKRIRTLSRELVLAIKESVMQIKSLAFGPNDITVFLSVDLNEEIDGNEEDTP